MVAGLNDISEGAVLLDNREVMAAGSGSLGDCFPSAKFDSMADRLRKCPSWRGSGLSHATAVQRRDIVMHFLCPCWLR